MNTILQLVTNPDIWSFVALIFVVLVDASSAKSPTQTTNGSYYSK